MSSVKESHPEPCKVKIRYVDFGTRFESAESADRTEEDRDQAPQRLFRNEFALDVGGGCHGFLGEMLWILDHHFTRGEENFPSASAAVLHHAAALVAYARDLKPRPDCFWCVIHTNPDFDALLSAYLVTYLLQHCMSGSFPDGSRLSFIDEGLHPGSWRDVPLEGMPQPRKRIDWYRPPLVDGNKRWMLLLAATACYVDNGRSLRCPVDESLPSVFYAALERQRPYKGEAGAAEFFDVARIAIEDRGLNPIWDALFDTSTVFAPELKLLAGSEEAYERDVEKARKSVVHLPFTSDFESFYKELQALPLIQDSGIIEPRQTLLDPGHGSQATVADLPSLQADGIWIRDPECVLFKQFARADHRNSPGGKGFLFTAIAYSGIKAGSTNRSDYFFSLDPERALGRHLYPVWSLLQAEEVEAIQKNKAYLSQLQAEPKCRKGFEDRAGHFTALFGDPWFDGSNYKGTIVVTPSIGTHISGEGTRSDLLDDRVAHIVRRLLEDRNLKGQIRCIDYQMDLARPKKNEQLREHVINVNRDAPPIPSGYVRFVEATLPVTIDLRIPSVAAQAGRQLWQFLYTDAKGGTPNDFVNRHLISDPDLLCVWGRRGIALASKETSVSRLESVKELLEIMVDVARVAEVLTKDLQRRLSGECCGLEASEYIGREAGTRRGGRNSSKSNLRYRKHTEECETNFKGLIIDVHSQLAKIAELQRQMALPAGRFLYPFFQASRLNEVLASVRDSHNALTTHNDNMTMRESLAKIQEVEENTDWLEIIIVGVYLLELVSITSQPDLRAHPLVLTIAWSGGFVLAYLVSLFNSKRRIDKRWSIYHLVVKVLAIAWIIGIFICNLFLPSLFTNVKSAPSTPIPATVKRVPSPSNSGAETNKKEASQSKSQKHHVVKSVAPSGQMPPK